MNTQSLAEGSVPQAWRSKLAPSHVTAPHPSTESTLKSLNSKKFVRGPRLRLSRPSLPSVFTTDFMRWPPRDISVNEEELQAILEEFRADYNRHHFVLVLRLLIHPVISDLMVKPARYTVEFERSCTAEFSGFLLYKERVVA
jgi:hypothetical protein